ncbi:hypothetical protein SLE2022_030440 [Rubroshorea leprosula]
MWASTRRTVLKGESKSFDIFSHHSSPFPPHSTTGERFKIENQEFRFPSSFLSNQTEIYDRFVASFCESFAFRSKNLEYSKAKGIWKRIVPRQVRLSLLQICDLCCSKSKYEYPCLIFD